MWRPVRIRLTAPSDELRLLVEDRLAFNPWIGLAAHRPLGSVMRARRPAYAAAREYRADANDVVIEEPGEMRTGFADRVGAGPAA